MLRLLDRVLTVVCLAAAALVLVLLFAGPSLIDAKKKQMPAGKAAPPGAEVFASAGCGSCHTLKAAGKSGAVGPNLDQVRPDAATVTKIVRSGRGAMPSFAGKLSSAQIAAVATYVSSVAGR
ncbi:MAG TPA: cytochrome c [Solirubrobacteraceae bacterium]|nr:cytochrome c [Solirubrobacteraceae bacterium]